MYHISGVVGYKDSQKQFTLEQLQTKARTAYTLRPYGSIALYDTVELSKDRVVQGAYDIADIRNRCDIFGYYYTVSNNKAHPHYVVYDRYDIKVLNFIDNIAVGDSFDGNVIDLCGKGAFDFAKYDGFSLPICFYEFSNGSEFRDNMYNLLGFFELYPPVEQVTCYMTQTKLVQVKISRLSEFGTFLTKHKIMG